MAQLGPFSVREGWGTMSIAISPSGDRLAVVEKAVTIHVFHRRRPYEWWGVFWLWEFWLAVAFAGVFVWSVVRDRRVLGKEEHPWTG